MKRVRFMYPGAYHHVMNRGYDGNEQTCQQGIFIIKDYSGED